MKSPSSTHIEENAGTPENEIASNTETLDVPAARITRRGFMQAAAASAGAVAMTSIGLPFLPKTEAWARGTVTRYPLHIPPVVSPSNLSLTCAPGTADKGDGKLGTVWAYNGVFPGPTLLANRGDAATITLHNGLAEETITHWHGMIVNHVNDGHPVFAIPPGGSYGYSFTIDQRACLNWYHPHPHMLTGEQVNMGLAGAFIVRDTIDNGSGGLGLPFGAYEVPLIIRDALIDKYGNLYYQAGNSGFSGNTWLVNGTLSPYLNVNRAIYRFRVLNGANARLFRLALSNGASFTIIGNDGGLLATAASAGQIEFGPGERLDLLVDFRGVTANTNVLLRDVNQGWDLLEFRVGSTSVAGTIPTALSTITALSNPVTTREFNFDGMSRINGQSYELNRIDFTVPVNTVERWRFITGGNGPHPVHVHGASFQVQSRTGGRGQLFPWESGWKDVVLLEDGETVEVLIKFTIPSEYVIHCHKLEHEDMGMMSNFEVV